MSVCVSVCECMYVSKCGVCVCVCGGLYMWICYDDFCLSCS